MMPEFTIKTDAYNALEIARLVRGNVGGYEDSGMYTLADEFLNVAQDLEVQAKSMMSYKVTSKVDIPLEHGYRGTMEEALELAGEIAQLYRDVGEIHIVKGMHE